MHVIRTYIISVNDKKRLLEKMLLGQVPIGVNVIRKVYLNKQIYKEQKPLRKSVITTNVIRTNAIISTFIRTN